MKYNDKYYICVFDTKNRAVFLYCTLEKLGYKNFQLISTPCYIQAGCGYSIKFTNIVHLDILKEEAKKINIEIEKVYLIDKEDGSRKVRRINV